MDKSSETKRKRRDRPSQTATDPHPGDYEIGSLESRAAARAVIEGQRKEKLVIEVTFVSPDGKKRKGPRYEIDRP